MKSINIKGKLLNLDSPKLMGILNITPDSFFAKSRYLLDNQGVIEKVDEMLLQGATFIDVGGHSTRPNADAVSEQEELDRILPVVEGISKNFPEAIITIDTFRSQVARKAVQAGAAIINDISGGNLDKKMFETVAELGVPYIIMHSRGTPQTMTQLADYQDVTLEVIDELQKKIYKLRQLGVKDIVLDPGFGFAKKISHNFEILRKLEAFKIFDLPLLIGISRKSMIWKTLKISADEALNGTTALNMYALMNGANILRVHDVKEAAETLKLYESIVHSR